MLIVALFIKTKVWKQHKCPLADEWISKTWYIHILEYHSALKRKKILTYALTWINIECIMLNEISQSQKDRYCMIHLLEVPRVVRLMGTESKMVVAKGWEKR